MEHQRGRGHHVRARGRARPAAAPGRRRARRVRRGLAGPQRRDAGAGGLGVRGGHRGRLDRHRPRPADRRRRLELRPRPAAVHGRRRLPEHRRGRRAGARPLPRRPRLVQRAHRAAPRHRGPRGGRPTPTSARAPGCSPRAPRWSAPGRTTSRCCAPTWSRRWSTAWSPPRRSPAPDRQPRAGCRYGSTALVAGRVGVIERCAGESPTGSPCSPPTARTAADKPAVEFSVALPARRGHPGRADRRAGRGGAARPGPAADVRPGRARRSTRSASTSRTADLAADPPGGVAAVRGRRAARSTGGPARARSRSTRRPCARCGRVPGRPRARPALRRRPAGPGARRAGRGRPGAPAPCCAPCRSAGPIPLAPVRLDAAGEVLLEQRGTGGGRAAPAG